EREQGGEVEVQARAGGGRGGGPARAGVRRERRGEPASDADGSGWGARRAERRPRAAHRLLEHRLRLERLPGRDRIAFAEKVPRAHLERIHSERGGQRIHLPLVSDARLDGAEGPVGAGDGIVGIGGDGVDVDMRYAIWAGGRDQAVEEDPWRQCGVRAGIGVELRLERDQFTAARRAGPVPQYVGMALAVTDEG